MNGRLAGRRGILLALSLGVALVASSCATPSSRDLEGPVVETGSGSLVGVEAEGVRRFRGIPFAEPPVDELRFRSPEKAADWEGIREATRFSPICAQARVSSGAFEVEGDEDCLYLNVYAPAPNSGPVENAASASPPVLVWIHGGGRRVGNGRRDVADFVRETQTVVVTIQYRLSHFAFFAHPALSAEDSHRLGSGNYGFEDAIAALRWVRSEIGAFGGDSERVTIGGLSGGGSMVCGLLVSPEAAGLFDAAIIQSGSSCWFPTDSIELAEERGRENARALGCREEEGSVPDCLRAQPVAAFYESLGRMLNNPFPKDSTESFAAMPMLGARSGHQVDGHVFPRSWPRAFHDGVFHRVPVMIGVTQQEGRLIYGQLLYDMGSRPFDEAEYQKALMGLTGSERIARAAAERFPLAEGGRTSAETFADVATVAHYQCPLAEMAANIGRFAPTYFYEYRVPGPFESDQIELGAYHGADTDTLFGGGYREPLRPFGPRQERAAQHLRGYVSQFMKTGDPNGIELPDWPRHAPDTGLAHLAFDDVPRADSGLRERACEFWRAQDWEALPRF